LPEEINKSECMSLTLSVWKSSGRFSPFSRPVFPMVSAWQTNALRAKQVFMQTSS